MLFPPCRLVPAGVLCAIVCALHPAEAAKVLLWNGAQEEPIWVLNKHNQALHDSPAEPGTMIPIELPDGESSPWELQVVDKDWNLQRAYPLAYTLVQEKDRVEPRLIARNPGPWLSLMVPAGPGTEPVWAFHGFPEAPAAGAGVESTVRPALACGHPLPPRPLAEGTQCPECYVRALLGAPRIKIEPGVNLLPMPRAEDDDRQEESEAQKAQARLLAMLKANPDLIGSLGSGRAVPQRDPTRAEAAKDAVEALLLQSAQELVAKGETVATMKNKPKASALQRQLNARIKELERSGEGDGTEAEILRAALGTPPALQVLPGPPPTSDTDGNRASDLRRQHDRTGVAQAELDQLEVRIGKRKAGRRRYLELAQRVAGNPESLTPEERTTLQGRLYSLNRKGKGGVPATPVEPTEARKISDVLEEYNREALRLARDFLTHPEDLTPPQRLMITTRLRMLRGATSPGEIAERQELAAVLGPFVSAAWQLAQDLKSNPARVATPEEVKALKRRLGDIHNRNDPATPAEVAEIAEVVSRFGGRGIKRKAADESPEPPPPVPSMRDAFPYPLDPAEGNSATSS